MNSSTCCIPYATIFLLLPIHAMQKNEGVRVYNFIGQYTTNAQNNLNTPAHATTAPARRLRVKQALIGMLALTLIGSCALYYYLQNHRIHHDQHAQPQPNTRKLIKPMSSKVLNSEQ